MFSLYHYDTHYILVNPKDTTNTVFSYYSTVQTRKLNIDFPTKMTIKCGYVIQFISIKYMLV